MATQSMYNFFKQKVEQQQTKLKTKIGITFGNGQVYNKDGV